MWRAFLHLAQYADHDAVGSNPGVGWRGESYMMQAMKWHLEGSTRAIQCRRSAEPTRAHDSTHPLRLTSTKHIVEEVWRQPLPLPRIISSKVLNSHPSRPRANNAARPFVHNANEVLADCRLFTCGRGLESERRGCCCQSSCWSAKTSCLSRLHRV